MESLKIRTQYSCIFNTHTGNHNCPDKCFQILDYVSVFEVKSSCYMTLIFFSCNFFAEEEEQVSAVWIDSLSSLRKSCSWTKAGSTTSQCQLTLTGRAGHVLFNNRNGHGAPSCFEVQFFLLICDSQKNKPIILSYVGENVSARNLLVHIHVQFDRT